MKDAKVWLWRAKMVEKLIRRWCAPARLPFAAETHPLDHKVPAILMAKDESDILEEFLRTAERFFAPIFVLDGSENESWEESRRIYERSAAVARVMRDADVADGPVRDGARHHLLDALRSEIGVGHWIGVLHADEFFNVDPRPFLASLNPRFSPTVRVQVLHHFLHTSTQHEWTDERDAVAEKVPFFMWPGVAEERFFFDDGSVNYEVNRHSRVVPEGLPPGAYLPGVTVSQFNYRSPKQAIERSADRSATGWQTSHYSFIEPDDEGTVFVDTLNLNGNIYAKGGGRRHRAGIASATPRVFTEGDGILRSDPLTHREAELSPTVRRLLEQPGRLKALKWALSALRVDSFQLDADAQARVAVAIVLANSKLDKATRSGVAALLAGD